MPSYAKTIIMGHVGTIKANYTQTGKKITSFTVAVNRKFNEEEQTDWFNVKTTMDWVEDKIQKGDLVLVEGTPQTREYQGKIYYTIWADNIKLIKKPNKQGAIEELDEPPF
jgi:single-stranded DNA-binding protein